MSASQAEDQRRQDLVALADALIDLGGLALDFGQVDRTAVYHRDGVMPESDTDHTVMLGWVAAALAHRCFPGLDVGLVAQFALIHDAPEVYAGDTPTIVIDEAGRAAKAAREEQAVQRIEGEFVDRLPWFPQTIRRYEDQELPEARFVRALDKCLPKIVHLLDGLVGLREERITASDFTAMIARQRWDIGRYAGQFGVLMDLHAELAARVLHDARLPASYPPEPEKPSEGARRTVWGNPQVFVDGAWHLLGGRAPQDEEPDKSLGAREWSAP